MSNDNSKALLAKDVEVVHLAYQENITGPKTFKEKTVFNADVSIPNNNLTGKTVNEIYAAIGKKSNDNEVVHLAGNETITGSKTFSNSVTVKGKSVFNNDVSIPNNNLTGKTVTEIYTAIGKKANDNEVVHLIGDETISGIKTFTNNAKFSGNVTVGGNITCNLLTATKISGEVSGTASNAICDSSGNNIVNTYAVKIKTVTITKSITIDASYSRKFIIVTNNNVTITLPKITTNGFMLYVKNGTSYTSVTIKTNNCKIDGLSSISLSPYECVMIISDGTNWWRMDTSARFQ